MTSHRGDAFMALCKLRMRHHDEALRTVARALRDGCTEPGFTKLLADLIDPDARAVLGFKLSVKRTNGAGAPPSGPNVRLEVFLECHIDFFDTKTEAVFAEAKRRFGVSRSTCASALKNVRERRKRHPPSFEMDRETALLLRDAGDPDYQLL